MAEESNNNQSPAKQTAEENERLAKWRAERAAVAEQQKQQRLAEKEQQQQRQQQANREAAQALIPTAEAVPDSQLQYRQRQTAQRRQLRQQLLLLVLLPTLMVFVYQSVIATPLFTAKTVLSVSSKQGEDTVSTLGGLTGLGGQTSRMDVHSALAFLHSHELLEQLEHHQGTLSRLSSDRVDPFYRLRNLPLLMSSINSRAAGFIKSSMDIQSGLITLEVQDLTPEDALRGSALITQLVSRKTDELSNQLFSSRLSSVNQTVAEARQTLTDATLQLTQLQLDSGLQDPMTHLSLAYQNIATMENELLAIQLQLEKFQASNSNNAQTRILKQQQLQLRQRLDNARANLLNGNGDGQMNQLIRRYNQAQLEVQIASEILTAALQAQTETEQEAALGRSMVQIVVGPQVQSTASHPRVLQSTLLAAVCFYMLFLLVRLVRRG
ncbi:hypothetical protein [Ferrimonas senticii]|uniref:hypothetical protein n=1 Tax=Ferrimonas senticii TaxID=394566 RepID=UPI00042563D8|nr:hypothetical protein [Ferrimonas senticii]